MFYLFMTYSYEVIASNVLVMLSGILSITFLTFGSYLGGLFSFWLTNAVFLKE